MPLFLMRRLLLGVTNQFLSSLPLLNRDNNEPLRWIEVFKLIGGRWSRALHNAGWWVEEAVDVIVEERGKRVEENRPGVLYLTVSLCACPKRVFRQRKSCNNKTIEYKHYLRSLYTTRVACDKWQVTLSQGDCQGLSRPKLLVLRLL